MSVCLRACSCAALEKCEKTGTISVKDAPCSTSRTRLSQNMNQQHLTVTPRLSGKISPLCGCLPLHRVFELLLFVRRRHGEAGMADRGGTMPPFHGCPLCTDPRIVRSPLVPFTRSHPASWHGDGSAVDKVHNTPSSPRHNRGTWTQAPLWHTRG